MCLRAEPCEVQRRWPRKCIQYVENNLCGLEMAIPDDMNAALEACYAECETRVDAYAAELDAVPPPSTIYHYTDSVGFRGILESGMFRLTDIFALNDPAELRHGIKYAGEILDIEAKKGHPAAVIFARNFREFVEEGAHKVADFFVGCFSSADDDLGQWRAYADNGQGFALGFDGRLLEEAFATSEVDIKDNRTFPISYDEEKLQKIQGDLVRGTIPLIALPAGRNMSNADINEYIKALSINFSIPTIRTALFFKHKAYRNEDEYRFLQIRSVTAPKNDIRTRTRRYSTIRYVEFDWRKVAPSALKEIVIGPAAAIDDAELFAENCRDLFLEYPTSVKIRRSGIPYRVS